MKFLGKGLAVGVVAGWACVAGAFPSWMGVYGDYTTHNGSNPGVYTILMNQDYWGLHAEVGIGISNQWTTHAMTRGNSGNRCGSTIRQLRWRRTPLFITIFMAGTTGAEIFGKQLRQQLQFRCRVRLSWSGSARRLIRPLLRWLVRISAYGPRRGRKGRDKAGLSCMKRMRNGWGWAEQGCNDQSE